MNEKWEESSQKSYRCDPLSLSYRCMGGAASGMSAEKYCSTALARYIVYRCYNLPGQRLQQLPMPRYSVVTNLYSLTYYLNECKRS